MTSFSRRGTLAVICLATAMLMLDIAVVNTALPHIARDLHSGLSGLQWVVDAYTLALATIVLTTGSVADRRGRRRVFAAGLTVFTASSLACALASSIVMLDVARAVQGAGAAAMFACSLALLADAFPASGERAKALAAYGATIGASFALGPLVGGGLTTGLGWRAVFYINIPIGLAALAATYAWVRESRDPNARQLDWPGQIALTGGLFLLVLALLRGNGDGWGSTAIVAELAGAALLLAAFVAVEHRSSTPMLPLGLFRRPQFAGAQIAAFSISATFFALYLYLTLYLQNILHMSAIGAGLAYLPATVLVFVVSGASAGLVEKHSMAKLIGGGLALTALGMALLLLTSAHSSWTIILPGMLVAGIGTGLFNPAVSSVALSSTPREQSGLAAGVNDTARQAGIALGVAVFGALVPSAAALGHGSGAAYVNGLHNAIYVAVAIAALGAIASLRLIGSRRRVAAEMAVAVEA
jgi:EmrB/QacA subfamily drug resistance transporter